MNLRSILVNFFFTVFLSSTVIGQYAPPAGQPGTNAIAKDSSIIKAWASGIEVVRGPISIADPSASFNGNTFASFGEPEDALGPAEGGSGSVLSLGDGGYATLTFEHAIRNGEGPDFCVFENSFRADYLELAFVEVSSDGINFVRFPAHSLTQATTQIGGFGTIDATKINNLAGKYHQGYGVPFDLEELKDSSSININTITHVRIIDVVGSIDPQYASYDIHGDPINDPFPTAFDTGGFDLDAVGVIHENTSITNLNQKELLVNIYPNPASEKLVVNAPKGDVLLYTITGELISTKKSNGNTLIFNISNLPNGIYLLKVFSNGVNNTFKIIVE